MFGSHLSIAGGMHHALTEAQSLKMDCVQVFTKNQRQWTIKPLTEEQIKTWHDARKTTGIDQVVCHDSYLINLANPDKDKRERSMSLFREELLRCDQLEIPYLVTHPGAHLKEGEEAGIKLYCKTLSQVHKDLPGLKVVTCLETTAGQGTCLGWRLEHLQQMLNEVTESHRLGVCVDTAHLIAAGYDLTSQVGAMGVIQQMANTITLQSIKVLHLNDSKIALGKRVDRHEHIGHGTIAKSAFACLLSEPALMQIPKILETSKEAHPEGLPWDLVNIETLKKLQKQGLKARSV
ncbi:MAG: deoxyribonuclease IV [Phycisphaeraceae bacterium]|nr:deoxyribonuclease IV [Phycisphaeraceae bacterium]